VTNTRKGEDRNSLAATATETVGHDRSINQLYFTTIGKMTARSTSQSILKENNEKGNQFMILETTETKGLLAKPRSVAQ